MTCRTYRPRRRRPPQRAVQAMVASLLLLSVAAGCTGRSRTGVPNASPSASPSAGCLPYRTPRSLADIDATVTGYRDVPEFRGGDVGADTQLPDGRRVWVFGDTLRDNGRGGLVLVRNSMLVFGPGCVTAVNPSGPGAVVPDRSDGVGYWPMSLLVLPRDGYDLLDVFYQRVRGSAVSEQFTTLGPALAQFRVPHGGLPALQQLTELGPDQPDQTARTWGAAAWRDGDHVYLYGTANPRRPYVFGYSLAVARAGTDHLAEQSTWEYWDGTRWSADARPAAELIAPVGGVSQTLSVLRHGTRWYAISKRDDYLGSDLVLWDAPGPTGPFHAGAPVASIPSDPAHHHYQYMPLAHPDLLPRSDSIVVSVCQNSDDVQTLTRNPLLYRPRFLQIPVP